MRVSREEIEAKRTPNGGFTRATLAGWGVPWPPPKGWLRTLMGGKPIEDFTQTNEWRRLRYFVFKRDCGKCVVCGRGVADGAKLQADHVKPRSLYPDLELDPDNVVTSCSDCNIGKGNSDQTDWRMAS